MAIETDADRAIFFAPEDFGGLATIQIDGGATLPDVPGIYDGPNIVAAVRQDNQFTSSHSPDLASQYPSFHTRESHVPGVKNGAATIVIHEPFFATPQTFRIHNVGRDGTGLVVLTLKRA